jgi:signal transduction histidine kinase
MRQQPANALVELNELQKGVAREYDEVRKYIRSLAGVDAEVEPRGPANASCDPRCQIAVSFGGAGMIAEQLLQIMLEGLRNARQRAKANSVTINLSQAGDKIVITIDDDGVGFSDSAGAPWANWPIWAPRRSPPPTIWGRNPRSKLLHANTVS